MADENRVLVTGASRGIGRAIALRLAAEGYLVAGCFRHASDAARRTESEIRALGVPCYFAECDVADAVSVNDFVSAAEENLGALGLVVNNAGINKDDALVVSSDDDWHAMLGTNLTGLRNICRAMAFRFMKRRAGVIVNMSSVAGVYGNPGQTSYAATKAGIIGFSRSLAKEVAAFGVRVNVVAPGFIETGMTDPLGAKLRAAALNQIPLRRFGNPTEVAEVVEFLLSERSAYLTGQVIQVDGGISL